MRPALAIAAGLLLTACGDDDAPQGESSGATSSPGSDTASTTTAASTTAPADSTGQMPADGWQVTAELGPELGMAMSVWGPSRDQAMVAGGQRSADSSSGYILARIPDGWAAEPLPEGTPMLDWLGTAGDDLWAVGLSGAALRREDTQWVAHETGTTITLWGVWGAGPDEVWVVGGDGVTEDPTLLRWDGTSFTAEPLPMLPADAHGLFKVWGASASEVFVAGDDGMLLRRTAEGWVLDTPGSIAPFISLWGTGADEVIAVGGRSNARIARWDGTAWQDVVLEPAGLNGVWVAPDGTATLVGRMGGIFELPPGSLEPVEQPTPTPQLLHAVYGFDDGSRMAVGGSFEGAPPWSGVIVEVDG